MNKLVVGIDPDVFKSGVAWLDTETREAKCVSLDFGELVDALLPYRNTNGIVVVVEAGWLNQKASWHCNPREPNNVSAKKGLAVGRNQQIGRDIVGLCKVFGIDCHEQIPLRKYWRGKDGKITHEEIVAITGITKSRTNQEERDALLLAWVWSGLPVRLKNSVK